MIVRACGGKMAGDWYMRWHRCWVCLWCCHNCRRMHSVQATPLLAFSSGFALLLHLFVIFTAVPQIKVCFMSYNVLMYLKSFVLPSWHIFDILDAFFLPHNSPFNPTYSFTITSVKGTKYSLNSLFRRWKLQAVMQNLNCDHPLHYSATDIPWSPQECADTVPFTMVRGSPLCKDDARPFYVYITFHLKKTYCVHVERHTTSNRCGKV